MHTINYTTARAHLAETMDRVNEDRTPLLVTRQKGEPVVMMSLAEYNALEETAYLLRSPANAERLIKSIGNLRAGKTKSRQLIEERISSSLLKAGTTTFGFSKTIRRDSNASTC